MTTAFAARFPRLFHVTERNALASIKQLGLLSAAELVRRFGAGLGLAANRACWTPIATPQGQAVLRRQGMPDRALASRLDPAIGVAAWRRFINDQVFLFASEAEAWRLLRAEPGRDHVVLAVATADLAGAGIPLRFCRFNNGYIDRSPPDRRRLRGFGDYRPIADWRPGMPVREVTVVGSVPPSTPWACIPVPLDPPPPACDTAPPRPG